MSSKSLLTVTTPAADFDIITLSELKERLNVTGTSQDDDLRRKLHEASQAIANHLNRVLLQETVLETFYGLNPRKWINLKRTPIISITSIILDSAATPVDSDLYQFDPLAETVGYIWPLDSEGHRVYYPESWGSWSTWCGDSIVEIRYVGGHTKANMPFLLKAAVAELVKSRLEAARQGSNVSKIEIPGVWAKTLDTTSRESNILIPDYIQDMIQPYKRMTIVG